MGARLYILSETGAPSRVGDVTTWALWIATADRVVARDEVGGVVVSTLFLGIDHATAETPRTPLLWETMIVGGPEDGDTFRSSSRAAAEACHASVVALVRRYQPMNRSAWEAGD